MFSFSTTFQPQVTSQLIGQLINALHSLKNSASSTATASVQGLHKDPTVNLRDLGLSDLRVGQLDELLNRLLPSLGSEDGPAASRWRTSHVSQAESWVFLARQCSTDQTRVLYKSSVQSSNTGLNRGFKTLRKSRRVESGYTGPAEPEGYTPTFMKVSKCYTLHKSHIHSPNALLDREFGMHSINLFSTLPNTRNVCFPTTLTKEDQADSIGPPPRGNLRPVKNPVSLGFRTTSGLDSQVDPVQVKSVTFEHVKGAEEAKNELQDVVEFLRNPQKFTVLGGKLPKGILLIGPPGTGKTLLARAVAGEADVPFFYASGSEFDEMFVGVGASRIRNLFKEAKANAPCVIFIDELDSVGGKRIESPMHPYSRQTINQLLAEMDGFKPNEGVIVIGATNFAEALDNALVRPGRFDMQVTVPRPDVKGRTEILNWYLQKIKIIARGTVGFTGAELENLVNQAALKAAVDGLDLVTMKELEFSKDKILMGPERKSVEIDKKNKQITAYHESGHAIVAYYTKDAMPINKATIMPRGPTLGHVSMLPENDRWSETRAQLLAQMDVSMGASSDFDGATKIAKMMVTRFGMSDKLGVMTYADLTKQSPETQAAIEQEVRVLLKDSYERAKNLLKTYSDKHKTLAEALLTYETLDAKEIKLVLEGKSLDPR
ncbi:unnamed protein product [Coregonus sp. 'balchen']|nr:unnamed protein product [Coregonus sp. 'balchen']